VNLAKSIKQKGKKNMANKRKLKKRINQTCATLFAECVAASLYGTSPHIDDLNAFAFSIVKLQDNALRRISHPEPGIPAKKYYRDVSEQLSAQISDLLNQTNV
jgi:hypothetical protein